MKLNKKIIMGGAQFGMKYGIANKNGEISSKQLNQILNYAVNNKMTLIDTAISYDRSLKKIFELTQKKKLKKKFQVIIKINDLSSLQFIEFEKLFLHFDVHCIMAHSSEIFLKKTFQKKIKLLRKFFKFKIGVSIYENKELERLKKFYNMINIIQIPYNIINFKNFDDKIFYRLKKNKIELHARSIFYQGVLLMNENKIQKLFKKFSINFIRLKALSKINKIDLNFLCIKFVQDQKFFDKWVFGFDSLRQLKEIIKNINSKKKIPDKILDYIKKTDLSSNLPDPRNF